MDIARPCGKINDSPSAETTGYSDRLHARSTGTREMSGDGIAMAWRVGATLANLEMQWWHTNDVAYPPTWQRMQVYPNPMLGSEKSARMVNSQGTEFFNQQQDDPLAYGPYTVQLKALAKQQENRYTTAADFADDLRRVHLTTTALPASRQVPASDTFTATPARIW